MKKSLATLFSGILLLLGSANIASACLFEATITMSLPSGDSTKQYCEDTSISEIINKYKGVNLTNEFPGYSENSTPWVGTANFRGLKINATVNFHDGVKQLGVVLSTADGTTIMNAVFQQRFGSSVNSRILHNDLVSTTDVWQQLVDWLQGKNTQNADITVGGSAQNILQTMADAWVAQTAIDPVTGNPTSFFAQLTQNNFALGANTILNGDTSGLDLFSLSPSYSNITNNGYTIKQAQLPLQYSHYFNRDNALIIDMPIEYQQVQEAKAYSVALGLGYTHVMLRTQQQLAWSLTPSFHYGAVGSLDLGSGTLVWNGGLASRLALPVSRMNYGMTNSVSYLKTASLTVGDVETPYKLSNTTLLNGVDATYSINNWFNVGGYYNRFEVVGGATWYIPEYNELGVKFAKETKYQSAVYDHLTASIGYLFAPHYSAANLTLGFNF